MLSVAKRIFSGVKGGWGGGGGGGWGGGGGGRGGGEGGGSSEAPFGRLDPTTFFFT